jgi:hypothetical protein
MQACLAGPAAKARSAGKGSSGMEIPADKLEFLAHTFSSGWQSSALERALFRTELPTKLRQSARGHAAKQSKRRVSS